MEKIEAIISNEELYSDHKVSQRVKLIVTRQELETISDIVLRNGAEVLIRNTK